jgi:cell division protein FtsQ
MRPLPDGAAASEFVLDGALAFRQGLGGARPTSDRSPGLARERIERLRRRKARSKGLIRGLRRTIVLLPAAAAAFAAVFVWIEGDPSRLARAAVDRALQATVAAGYGVKTVSISGLERLDPETVRALVGAHPGDPTLGIDTTSAEARIEEHGWVKRARVTRILPDTLNVSVVERRPMALWQRGRGLVLVDDTGVVLPEEDMSAYVRLPVIVGDEAPHKAARLLDALSGHKALTDRLRAAVLVGNRRWDLHLDGGIVVRLPEGDIAEPLRILDHAQTNQRLFDREIVAVDLRLRDRLVIRETGRAAEFRISAFNNHQN